MNERNPPPKGEPGPACVPGWLEENKIERVSTSPSSIRNDKFALLLAKIAHGYAVAECGSEVDFVPILKEILERGTTGAPLHSYLIGGESKVEPPSSQLHELGIIRRENSKYSLRVVRIRLFAKFGAPTYYVVVSALPRNQRR